MRMRRIELVLTVLTAALAATGVGLWIWQPPLPAAAKAPDLVSPAPGPRSVSVVPSVVENRVIVDANIFSSTRAAPRVRYTPPGAGDERDVASMSEAANAAMIVETPLPQVFGTMTGPGGSTALIQSDSAGASGRLYREGDQVGQYRIIRITGGSVVVRGPSGRHELKIQSREAPGR